jgi:hypothetical protein
MKGFTKPHLMSSVRISGFILPSSPYAFMAFRGRNSPELLQNMKTGQGLNLIGTSLPPPTHT